MLLARQVCKLQMRHRTRVKPKLPSFSNVMPLCYGKLLEKPNSISASSPILVLPNHQYMVARTGQICNMHELSEPRADDIASVCRTMRKYCRLELANFNGGAAQLWVTQPFCRNVLHPMHAYQAFTRFRLRMRRRYRVSYISELAPLPSGNWHFHVLMCSEAGSS